ncbi:MAG: NERD domain-containing protein [Bacteroidales bacterium]|nr:NERD domain-containing protein [Bacteroidales bacterium]
MDEIFTFGLLMVILIIYVVFSFNRAKIIGKKGELNVNFNLHFLSNEYHLFDDVYIYLNDKSIQIDHIVVSKYGVFVIETKNIKGWILGGDNSEYWTKNVYGKKYKFYNPVKQNYSHVKALQILLKISRDKFIPIVAFLPQATLKCTTSEIVITSNKLLKTIRNYKDIILTDNDVDRIVMELSSLSGVDRKMRKQHVDDIKRNVEIKKEKINACICPKCNGVLIERRGPYGKFLGCSNYPKCNFTQRN